MFTPADFVAYLRRAGAVDSYQPPAGVVLCYQRSLYHHVLKAEGLKSPARQGALHGLLLLPSTGGRVGLLGQFGIGAPAAAAALEELAAMGTGAFVSVGTAGSLQRDLDIGDLVLCEAAIRDEGVSHHYLPPAKLATADAGMTAALGAALGHAGVPFRSGSSWTIDTPYRETVAEARHYQAEGVLCVEMEAAALFAVAEVRRLRRLLGLRHQRLPRRPGLEPSIPRAPGPGRPDHAVQRGGERPAGNSAIAIGSGPAAGASLRRRRSGGSRLAGSARLAGEQASGLREAQPALRPPSSCSTGATGTERRTSQLAAQVGQDREDSAVIFGCGRQAQLGEDAPDVGLDGLGRHVQTAGDRVVGAALGHLGQHG